MHISPFFYNLRSAYAAELEDMSHDSDGQFILARRLEERRSELKFLISMLEISPEMVAVVLHKAFRFTSAQAMDQLLACEPEDLTEWESLSKTIEIAPWANAMVQTLRKQPAGDNFLSVAAALEYMAGSSQHAQASHADGEDTAEDEGADHDGDDQRPLSADDADDTDSQRREDVGADWMADQGFDRKD